MGKPPKAPEPVAIKVGDVVLERYKAVITSPGALKFTPSP